MKSVKGRGSSPVVRGDGLSVFGVGNAVVFKRSARLKALDGAHLTVLEGQKGQVCSVLPHFIIATGIFSGDSGFVYVDVEKTSTLLKRVG